MKQTLEWADAPNSTTWGAGMKEAIVPLGADATLLLYCHADDTAAAEDAFRPAMVMLTEDEMFSIATEKLGFGALNREDMTLTREIIEAAISVFVAKNRQREAMKMPG